MKKRSAIIIGGGIGGLALARFLVADGHSVTVVERARDFSAQGHSISLRGVGFQVMDELGLRAPAERIGRNFRGNRFYTMGGSLLRVTSNADSAKAVGGIAVTQRGLLHAVLHENLPPEIKIKFGVKPNALRDDGQSVQVDLSDGTTLQADIVVGADGANSAVRALVAPDVEPFDFGGLYIGMTIKCDHRLPVNEISSFNGTARLIAFFPVDATTVAVVLYQDDGYGPTPTSNAPEDWAPYLKRTFKGTAEPVQRILAALSPGDDIYHDRIRQIPPNVAARGRIALLGDAGYCPTFFSGNGAALAAVGAYCLAKCLRNTDDDTAALKEYERRILAFAASYQANARILRNVLFTRSPIKVLLRRLALRFTPGFIFLRNTRRHYRGEAKLSDCI